MFPTLQRQLGQREMRIRGRGDNDNIDGGILDHVFGTAVRLDTRVVLFGIIVGLGSTLDNRVEIQFGDLLDEGDMEGFGAEAVADYAYIPGLGGHID